MTRQQSVSLRTPHQTGVTHPDTTRHFLFSDFSRIDFGAVGMTSQDFSESRKTQLVQALQSAGAEQVNPIKPKSEAELEADRSAAAIALNAVFLRELKSRHGEVEPKITAVDVTAVALANSMERARARQTA